MAGYCSYLPDALFIWSLWYRDTEGGIHISSANLTVPSSLIVPESSHPSELAIEMDHPLTFNSLNRSVEWCDKHRICAPRFSLFAFPPFTLPPRPSPESLQITFRENTLIDDRGVMLLLMMLLLLMVGYWYLRLEGKSSGIGSKIVQSNRFWCTWHIGTWIAMVANGHMPWLLVH